MYIDYRLQSIGTRTVNMSGATNAGPEITGTLYVPRDGNERWLTLSSLESTIGCRTTSGSYVSSSGRDVDTLIYFYYDGTKIRYRTTGEVFIWNQSCQDGTPRRFHYWRARFNVR